MPIKIYTEMSGFRKGQGDPPRVVYDATQHVVLVSPPWCMQSRFRFSGVSDGRSTWPQ